MKEKIKIGYIGLGRRGKNVLQNCLVHMDDVEFTAICDTYPKALEEGRDIITEHGRPEPIMTQNYMDIIKNDEIDAVIVMTGWAGRAEIAAKAMYAGKYAGIEVGCAFDISECYMLIEAYEKTGMPLMMLENCCYGRKEMMTLKAVKDGLFGEVVHCDGAYQHVLPGEDLFVDMDSPNHHYRIDSYINRNCENYPTHELGPIAKVLNINRGNRMVTLSSFASKSAGLKEFSKKLLGEDSPYSRINYKQGDIITTVITCAGGETIHLSLDTTLPRPYYSRNFTVRGSKGMYTEERHVMFLEGMEEGVHDNDDEMFEKHDHPLWAEYSAEGIKGGHSGMDWLVCRAFVESVKRGVNTPIDAYDTVALMAIAPLSEMSIAMGGAPVAIPDFTKGKWINREPIVEGKYCLDKVCVDPDTKI